MTDEETLFVRSYGDQSILESAFCLAGTTSVDSIAGAAIALRLDLDHEGCSQAHCAQCRRNEEGRSAASVFRSPGLGKSTR